MPSVNVARRLPAGVVALALAITSANAVWAQEKESTSQPARPEPVFDEQADAQAAIAAALARAERDNKRVLLMFGANWCGWSRKLDALFRENAEVARPLLYEYELVKVDVGRRDKNMDVAERYEADVEHSGIPFLTVLDAEGKVLINQETGALEEGDHHDPEKVRDFLGLWRADPQDAREVLKDALAQAARRDKRLFLYLGVPSCRWCRRLDDFLHREDMAQVIARDFIPVKIDLHRMTHADEVAKTFRKVDSGNPWFAVVDANRDVLATSVGPDGNVGYPVEPGEIAHFMTVLKKTARHITADDLRKIEQVLKDAAAAIKRVRQDPDLREESAEKP